MSLVDHSQSFQVPFSEKDTFSALKTAVGKLQGFSVDKIDDTLKIVSLKAGVSMFSWGENVTVSVERKQPGETTVTVLSTPKTGLMFGGAMDMGKNRKNISAISEALSAELKNYTPEEKKEEVNSVADEIQKLAELQKQGILSEEEFSQKKKQLLGL